MFNFVIGTNLKFAHILVERNSTTKIVMHHTVTPKTTSPAAIHNMHLENGWSGIGYHFLIDYHGNIYEGRPVGAQGSHTYGENGDSIGIAFIDDFSDTPPTATQYNAAGLLIGHLFKQYGVLAIHGHNAFNSTACPALLDVDRVTDAALAQFKELFNTTPLPASLPDTVQWAIDNGIVQGHSDGEIRPQEAATREQVMQMIKNYHDNFGD